MEGRNKISRPLDFDCGHLEGTPAYVFDTLGLYVQINPEILENVVFVGLESRAG